jgi:nitrilase
VREAVRVAVAQVEPAIFDRAGTIDKLEAVVADVAHAGAKVVLFPETFIPVYPSSRWARSLAGWGETDGKALWARLAGESVTVPSPETERIGAIAKQHAVVISVGVNELDGGTLYNTQLIFGADGTLQLTHRKLMPTNHERMVHGIGDGHGLKTVDEGFARVGGLICWENLMPLARAAIYEAGVEIYLAPTADDTESWLGSARHIARESRAFVLSCCVFQRASSYPDDVWIAEGDDLLSRGGSAIIAPTGEYLAGPLWDEEGVLYADLDPALMYAERQRFDPVGHYSRPDVLRLTVQPTTRATPAPE